MKDLFHRLTHKINKGVLIGYLFFAVFTYLLLSSVRSQYRGLIQSSTLSTSQISQKLKMLDDINQNIGALQIYLLQFKLDATLGQKSHRKYSIDSIDAKNTVLLSGLGKTDLNSAERNLFENFKRLNTELSDTRKMYLVSMINTPSLNPEESYKAARLAFKAFKKSEKDLVDFERDSFSEISGKSALDIRRTIEKVEFILLGFILISLLFSFVSLKLFMRLKQQYLRLKTALQEKDKATSHAHAILNALPANVALLDKTGKIIEVNTTWKYFLDNNAGNYGIGANLLEELEKDIPENGNKEVGDALAGILKGKMDSFSFLHSLLLPAGKRWFRVIASRENESEESGIIIMYLDITDKHEAEEKTKQAEARLIEFSENSQDVICSIDESGNFIHVSKAAQAIWGYEPEELRGKSYEKLVHEEDRIITALTAHEIMQGKPVTMFENRYIRKDGTVVPMLWSARWKADERTMYCVARNATEKKAAEEELKKAEANYREIFEKASDGIFILNALTDVIIQANQKSFEITGIPMENLINKSITDILSLSQRHTSQSIHHKIKQVIAGEDRVFEWEIEKEDASMHWIEVSCSLAIIAGEERILIFFHQIDARKEVELANAKITNDLAHRNSHLQQFAHMVSHKLRAPVASILGLSNVLEGELSESEKIKTQQFLFETVRQLDLIVKDLNNILELRTNVAAKKEQVNLNEVLNKLKSHLKSTIQNEEFQVLADVLDKKSVLSIQAYLESIFDNLISNSLNYKNVNQNTSTHIFNDYLKETQIISKDNGAGWI